MAVSNVWVLHGMSTPAQNYSQIENSDVSPVTDILAGFAAGHFTPLFKAVRNQKPEFRFNTTQLATLLTEVGQFGVDLSAGNTDFFLKKVDENATREADVSAVHQRFRAAQAFFMWNQITTSHNREASATCRVICNFDGSNEPIVPLGSLAIPFASTATEFFTLGPVKVNGSFIEGEQDMQLDLGQDVFELGAGGEVFDTFAAIRQINPVFTFRTLEADAWTDFSLTGTPVSDVQVYLRRIKQDGTREADGASQHIKISGTDGIIHIDTTTSGGNQEAITVVKLDMRSPNSTTNPLTIQTGQTIT